VDGASYDEPEEYLIEDGPAVRLAVASWADACDYYGDGEVRIAGAADTDEAMREEEFLELAADAIGTDAEESAEIRAAWGRGEVWRRER
jgi:hypothetical protein